jgi:hypothetical protein
MDARIFRAVALTAALVSLGASYRTPNFVVSAPTAEMAEQIGRAAEQYRRSLAGEWLGETLPTWAEPCPITAQVGDRLGAGGETSFLFERGEVYGWRMRVQGSLERILDSVLPHEVTHTIFATHFRRPLPRWADEGACTTVEHASERSKQHTMLISFLQTDRGIAFNRMFAMKQYPRDIMPLYSQGYSVARYLIAQGGRRRFVAYLGDGMRDEDWNRATRKYYKYETLGHLQYAWLEWVRQGSPPVPSQPPGEAVLLASNDLRTRPDPNLIYRGQSLDEPGESPYVRRGRRGAAAESGREAARETWPVEQATGPVADRGMEPPQDEGQVGPLPDPIQGDAGGGRSPRVLLQWTRPPDEPWTVTAARRNRTE